MFEMENVALQKRIQNTKQYYKQKYKQYQYFSNFEKITYTSLNLLVNITKGAIFS